MRPRRVRRGKAPRRAGRPVLRPARFNEAPASSPGKGGIRGGASRHWRRASMRPRRVRRGKSRFRPTQRRTSGCFNEAPASSPGKGVGRSMVVRAICAASMRPRRVRRGKAVRAAAGCQGGGSRPFFVLTLVASWAAGAMVWSARHVSGRQDALRAGLLNGRGRVLVWRGTQRSRFGRTGAIAGTAERRFGGGNQGVAGSRRWRTACSGHRA